MENRDAPMRLRHRRRVSPRHAGTPGAYTPCPCCRDKQKRKRTSVARPSARPSAPSPRPSTPTKDIPGLLRLIPRSTIAPKDLPVVSTAPPSPQPSTPLLRPNSPVRIHNHSVEDYQRIYHEVVDDMLMYKNGRPRPYTIELGRRIKQKLWERLDRPLIITSASEEGLVDVNVSYGAGVHPPLHPVDISGEPMPKKPPKKRAKTDN